MDHILTSFFLPDYIQMLLRLAICIAVNWLLVDRLYFPKSKRRDFYFTFMLINIAIFFLVFFMIFALEDMKAKTSMGIGIGLFGIFSIMRYRTDAMPVREMTYLFIIVSLAVVNAVGTSLPLPELIVTDFIVVALTWLCEKKLKVKASKLIQYDRIALIKPECHEQLMADLQKRTGLNIIKIEIGAIDLLKDTAMLRVFYVPEDQSGSNTVDHKLKMRREDRENTSNT